jgi:hypothetical protein
MKGSHLAIPHTQRGAEGIRQHEHGRALRPIDFDMDRTGVGVNQRHGFLEPGSFVARKRIRDKGYSEAMSRVTYWWGDPPASMKAAIEQFRTQLGRQLNSVDPVKRALDTQVPENDR